VKTIRIIPLLVVGLLVLVAAGCNPPAETKTEATGAAEAAKTGRGQEAGTAEMQPGPGNASADTRLGTNAGGK